MQLPDYSLLCGPYGANEVNQAMRWRTTYSATILAATFLGRNRLSGAMLIVACAGAIREPHHDGA